ncbi:MAG: 2TM domain-containing protein, partial [Thermomicrobiales bacterium]
MALRQDPADEMGTGNRPAKSTKGEAAFRGHLAVYLCVGLFLLTLNLLTSPGELWFYWPLFFWGWALVFQAVATYGADAPTRVLDVLRSMVPGLANAPPAAASTRRATNSAPFAATAFASVHDRIERLKEIAWQIPDGPVRDQAIRLSAAAERIAAVMAADRT